MKGFSELGQLKKALEQKSREEREARAREQAERARREREAQVFADAMKGIEPIKSTGRVEHEPQRPPATPRQRELDEQAALQASLSDEIDIERLLDVDESLSFRRPGIGSDVLVKLRRGHWVVQSQLDLHGLRVDQAREALTAFLARAVKREQRCLRVIHGKGLGSVGKEPVLKGKVLKWLVQRDEVIAFCQARPTDGGSGVLIVLLKALT
jgi:DNA-nicking Smr family endonuclease